MTTLTSDIITARAAAVAGKPVPTADLADALNAVAAAVDGRQGVQDRLDEHAVVPIGPRRRRC